MQKLIFDEIGSTEDVPWKQSLEPALKQACIERFVEFVSVRRDSTLHAKLTFGSVSRPIYGSIETTIRMLDKITNQSAIDRVIYNQLLRVLDAYLEIHAEFIAKGELARPKGD